MNPCLLLVHTIIPTTTITCCHTSYSLLWSWSMHTSLIKVYVDYIVVANNHASWALWYSTTTNHQCIYISQLVYGLNPRSSLSTTIWYMAWASLSSSSSSSSSSHHPALACGLYPKGAIKVLPNGASTIIIIISSYLLSMLHIPSQWLALLLLFRHHRIIIIIYCLSIIIPTVFTLPNSSPLDVLARVPALSSSTMLGERLGWYSSDTII